MESQRAPRVPSVARHARQVEIMAASKSVLEMVTVCLPQLQLPVMVDMLGEARGARGEAKEVGEHGGSLHFGGSVALVDSAVHTTSTSPARRHCITGRDKRQKSYKYRAEGPFCPSESHTHMYRHLLLPYHLLLPPLHPETPRRLRSATQHQLPFSPRQPLQPSLHHLAHHLLMQLPLLQFFVRRQGRTFGRAAGEGVREAAEAARVEQARNVLWISKRVREVSKRRAEGRRENGADSRIAGAGRGTRPRRRSCSARKSGH